MRLKRVILFFLFLFCAYWSSAQLQGEYVRSRILILLDGSSSMTQPWASGKEKYKAAEDLIIRLIDSVYAVNDQVQFGLRMFGHQSTVQEKNCYDTRNEVSFSTDNRTQIMLRLEDIHPKGITPIAYALQEAAEKDIVDEEHNVYSIILITDGGESCGGNICEVMEKLIKNKVYIKPYIVSLENDPSLKTTYNCMGEYLQVTNDAELPVAVKTIVDAFRPVLKISKKEYTDIQTVAAKAPSVLKVTIPVNSTETKKGAEKIPALTEAGLIKLEIGAPAGIVLQPTNVTKVIVKKTDPVNTQSLPLAPFKLVKTAASPVSKLTLIPGPFKLPPVVVETPVQRATDKIARLKPAPLQRLYWAMVMESHALSPRPVPPLPPVKATVFLTPTPEAITDKDHKVDVQRIDNNETTLEIFFTNGSGKFYTTTPQILLIDAATKNVVKKFYRTVDPDGNPDPQTNIPPGTYNITLATNSNFALKNVVVERNKKNKFTITVKNGSLSFIYANAPGRPIKEFTATVTERNKLHGRVQEQPCTEKIEYEPGNYHVEIKTFPVDYRNVELEFDIEKVITIQQPGFANFVTDGRVRSVNLWQHIGDKFLQFYTLNLNLPISKHLQIQPGEYQVHYQAGPGQTGASEKVKIFYIKPTEETIINLD